MKSPGIKTVLVGVGRMGENHLRILTESSDFIAVALIDPKFTGVVFKEPEGIPCFKSLDALENIDFSCVIVCTPTSSHLCLAEYFLKRGKDVFIEKPVCSSVAEGRRLLTIVQETEGKVFVGHVERFNPAVVKARDLLSSGVLGRPIHFSFTRVGGHPADANHDHNVLLDLAVHDLDILRYLGGEMEVLASVCHSTWREGIYDTSEMLLCGKAGFSASIHSNWVSPTKIRTMSITGTLGFCQVDYMRQTCVLHGGEFSSSYVPGPISYAELFKMYKNGKRTEFLIERSEPLANQLCALHSALTGHESSICRAADAVRSVELAERALSISEKIDHVT